LLTFGVAETDAKARLYLLTDPPKLHMLQTHFTNTMTLEMRMCYTLVNKIMTFK